MLFTQIVHWLSLSEINGMINRLDMKVMGGSLGIRRAVVLFCHHGHAWPTLRFKLLLAKAPLIYSKWPCVVWIKTNSSQLQFILKRSLDKIQLTSDHTCLLVHGGVRASLLISALPEVTSWHSDINHRVIKWTPRSKPGSRGLVQNSHLYYWLPLMPLFPFRSAAHIWAPSHISAAVRPTDNIFDHYVLCVTEYKAEPKPVLYRSCRKMETFNTELKFYSNTAKTECRMRGMENAQKQTNKNHCPQDCWSVRTVSGGEEESQERKSAVSAWASRCSWLCALAGGKRDELGMELDGTQGDISIFAWTKHFLAFLIYIKNKHALCFQRDLWQQEYSVYCLIFPSLNTASPDVTKTHQWKKELLVKGDSFFPGLLPFLGEPSAGELKVPISMHQHTTKLTCHN